MTHYFEANFLRSVI